ncbi:hypothetical protein ES705_45725 [subsurface metagenome]
MGLTPETSIASICSVTLIDPRTAPNCEAILPAHKSAVITGPISVTIETETIPGNHASAPNSINTGRDCNVITRPKINPVKPTNPNDLAPTKYDWYKNSLNSNGGRKSSLKNLCVNLVSSPTSINSSKTGSGNQLYIYWNFITYLSILLSLLCPP